MALHNSAESHVTRTHNEIGIPAHCYYTVIALLMLPRSIRFIEKIKSYLTISIYHNYAPIIYSHTLILQGDFFIATQTRIISSELCQSMNFERQTSWSPYNILTCKKKTQVVVICKHFNNYINEWILVAQDIFEGYFHQWGLYSSSRGRKGAIFVRSENSTFIYLPI